MQTENKGVAQNRAFKRKKKSNKTKKGDKNVVDN